MTHRRHLPVLSGVLTAIAVATVIVLPEYRRVHAIVDVSSIPTDSGPMDPVVMATLSIGATTLTALAALLFVSRVRRESFRVVGALIAPVVLGFVATIPMYRYVYGAFPGADHVAIPSVYRWSGPAAIASALIIWGLLHLWLTPTTTRARKSRAPEA